MMVRKLRIALIVVSGLVLVAAATVLRYVDNHSGYYFPNAYVAAMPLLAIAFLTGLPALFVFTITLGIHAVCEWPWRFRLHTVLIATTLVAVVLGLVMWANRR